jgi:dethiobiotin synthetase
VEDYNRTVLSQMAPLRAVIPGGAGELAPAQFAEMSRRAFDPAWVGRLVSGPV